MGHSTSGGTVQGSMSSPHHPERHPDDLAPPERELTRNDPNASGGRGLPRGFVWAGVLAVVVLTVMVWVNLGNTPVSDPDRLDATAEPPGGNTATINGPLPNVELTDLNGIPMALTDFAGQPMVVNFWASWCPPCIAEMPAFEEVFNARAGSVAFVGINVRESAETAADMAARTGVTYDLALDPNGAAARAFNVVNMPTTVFVTADGTIASVHAGALTSTELDERLSVLVGGATTPVS